MAPPLVTVGHGRLERAELTELLRAAGVERLVDVRRFPGSRTNDAAAKGVIAELSKEADIGYRWDERLGGRRRLTKEEHAASPDTWWRVDAFRAYAAWTRSEGFRDAVAELTGDARSSRTAILCSESVWWRCHRRIIADVIALERGIEVEHLMHSGDLREHALSDGARLGEEGRVVWDGL